ncbi:GGDEF domain-containing protein [Shewanella sp. YIC-542]|uniref:GGDEF domain-containing protein n=1 Tax=Shewanella mytili TaxID=3377111 RepID=UPI00398E8C18
MAYSGVKEKQWVLVKYAHSIVRPIGMVSIFFGLVALVGYLGNIEPLYRPIMNGPATNPLTAVCIILVGLAIQKTDPKSIDKWLQRLLVMGVLAITLSRMMDLVLHTHTAELIMPFHDLVIHEIQLGKSNDMGMNSSVMFCCIGISLLFYNVKRPAISQFFAFVAIAIPTISFTGYAYQLNNFYGQMSMLTAMAGFTLAVATLALTAHVGGLKAILSPYHGGTVARLQSLCGYIVPSVLGFLIIESLRFHDGNLFGAFVVSISWFIILMVSISAIYYEKVDEKRRHSERLLAEAVLIDPLTGLSNRRKLMQFGKEEIRRIHRNKNQAWVLILDIDYFKKINDTAGHDMGDRVLVALGRILKGSVRAVDLVSRLGGEEFAIILVDTTIQGAQRVADSLRQNIENMVIEGWTDIYGPITVSIGCAKNDGHGTMTQTMKQADEALYQAKHNGRNQVVFAAESAQQNRVPEPAQS